MRKKSHRINEATEIKMQNEHNKPKIESTK